MINFVREIDSFEGYKKATLPNYLQSHIKTVQHSVLKTPKRLELLDLIMKTPYAFLPFRIIYLLRTFLNVPELPAHAVLSTSAGVSF